MARPLRIEFPGALYHLTVRGNERRKIFFTIADKKHFLDLLLRAKERFAFLLYAYVLMENHFHLLLETPRANLSQIMQFIGTSHAVYVNLKRKRIGHLFQGRYHAILVEKESYLLEATRYIHLNPVRAGIVAHPEDYHWSSYADYVSKAGTTKLVESSCVLELFGKRTAEARRRYRKFVEEMLGQPYRSPLAKLKGLPILGGQAFIKRVKKLIAHRNEESELPDLKRLKRTHSPEEILRAVAEYYRIDPLSGHSPGQWRALVALPRRSRIRAARRSNWRVAWHSPQRPCRTEQSGSLRRSMSIAS